VDTSSSSGALQIAPSPVNEQVGEGVQISPKDKGISIVKKGGGKNGTKGGGKRIPRK